MPTPSKKRSRKNKRARDRKKRDRSKAAEQEQHVILRGDIAHRECRFELFISSAEPFAQPVPVNALIDTGATGISVSPSIAQAAGLRVVAMADVRTASDQHMSPVGVAILHLHAEGRTIEMMTPVIIEWGLADEMLFGMDGLEGGTLLVDRINEKWELRIKRIL